MAELPAGTVTLLFSDIEGSTKLMRALRDARPQAHADHRRIVRDAFRQAGGREVDTQGDAFFAVFPRARGALEAAAFAQRTLYEHPWPGDSELRVRIGVHTATPRSVRRGISASTSFAVRASARRPMVGRCSSRRRPAPSSAATSRPARSSETSASAI